MIMLTFFFVSLRFVFFFRAFASTSLFGHFYVWKCAVVFVRFVSNGIYHSVRYTQRESISLIRTLVWWHLFFMYVSLSFRSVTSSVCYFVSLHSLTLTLLYLCLCHRHRRRRWIGPNEITTTFITLSSDALRTISIGFLGIGYTYTYSYISEFNGSVNRRQSNIKKCLRELTTNFFWHHSI